MQRLLRERKKCLRHMSYFRCFVSIFLLIKGINIFISTTIRMFALNVVKFGHVVLKNCEKFTDRWTERQTDGRTT